VCGLNFESRQLELRAKIDESQCSIICVQETKCEFIDHRFIRKFRPKRFDHFVYSPSVGASGGILVLWNSKMFNGVVQSIQRFGIQIEFIYVHNGAVWNLVNVYGPYQGMERYLFVDWLYHLHIPELSSWLLLGDFNFIIYEDNRNRPGGILMTCFFLMKSLLIWAC
jgi:exonuclease III